MMAGGRLL